MKKYDIVIIGGSAGGLAVLKSCVRLYPDKSKLLIKHREKTLIPCAIPYVYKEIGSSEKNLIPNEMVSKMGADLIMENVTFIDKDNKVLKVEGLEDISYDKLVISTGSDSFIPDILGSQRENVFYIKKDADVINSVRDNIEKSKRIVIVGGGYIGVEFAEHISMFSSEKEIKIIESSNSCLSMTFDSEFTSEVEEKLRSSGVEIINNRFAVEFAGPDNIVDAIKLNDGNYVHCDMVIVAIGAKANVSLAEDSGFEIGKSGGIKVNKYMQTENKDVFACGDCAEKYSFFGHNVSGIKLASIACMEGRLVAENLYGNHFESKGMVGVYSTKIYDKVYAGAGFTESHAKNEGIDVVCGFAEVMNRHPGCFNDVSKIKLKLLFNRKNKVLIGAQVSGSLEVGETINMLGLAIENKNTVYDLFFMQPATQPKISASPLMYHVIVGAEDALSKF